MSFVSVLVGFLAGGLITYLVASFFYRKKTVSREQYDETKLMLDQRSGEHNSAIAELKENERNIGELSSTMAARGISVTELTEKLSEVDDERRSLNESVAGYEAINRNLMEKLSTQEDEIAKLHESSKFEFEKTARRILEENSEKLTAVNHENIKSILDPLAEKLTGFRDAVEESYGRESKQRQFLEGTVKDLVEQTSKVSEEAKHLTNALKGDTDRQGEWGEFILERLLENSGLVSGVEYFVRKPVESKDGSEMRPDITIQLPGDRTVVIDSRLPLEAYDGYLGAETDADRGEMLGAHLEAINTHISEVSGKHYDELESSLDFTMLFVPVEPAFLLAIQNDPDLLTRATADKVMIISPSNLVAVLKIVADLWTREKQNQIALGILKRGELLYEKFVGFAESMEAIGENLHKTQSSFDKATGQLKSGHGNLMGQAIKLKELGLKSDKEIPLQMHPTDSDEDLPLRLAAKK